MAQVDAGCASQPLRDVTEILKVGIEQAQAGKAQVGVSKKVQAAAASISDFPAPASAAPRGQKGARTRRRIMDATARLLEERPVGDIRITEIARAADIAQPNFYTYFPSIEAVILALAEEVSADGLADFVEPEWQGEAGLGLSRQLTEAGIALWRDNAAILCIVNLLADTQHGEFADLRVRQMRKLTRAMETKVVHAQAAGRLSPAIQPRLAAYECITVLASAGYRYELLRASGFSHEELVETTAQLVHRLLGAD